MRSQSNPTKIQNPIIQSPHKSHHNPLTKSPKKPVRLFDHGLLREAFVRWHVQPGGPLVTQQRLLQASRVVQGPGAAGKPMGKPWENHGKPMGKPWENHGKTMGKPWETRMLDFQNGDLMWFFTNVTSHDWGKHTTIKKMLMTGGL